MTVRPGCALAHEVSIVDSSTFIALAMACAPQVHPTTAHALVSVESAFNPWAIGVVGGALHRQPNSHAEALATAQQLIANGRNFSAGLGQINVGNFERLGLTTQSAFDPCRNLAAMQSVLTECFDRAASPQAKATRQDALRRALSCYYSGNFSTGFRHGYVQKVVSAAIAFPLPRFTPSSKEPS
jgi:type IV secretion system protein VirB1